MDCRGISVLVAGVPLPSPSLTCVFSAFSHSFCLFSLLLLYLCSVFALFWLCCHRGITSLANWLSCVLWWVHFWSTSVWHGISPSIFSELPALQLPPSKIFATYTKYLHTVLKACIKNNANTSKLYWRGRNQMILAITLKQTNDNRNKTWKLITTKICSEFSYKDGLWL